MYPRNRASEYPRDRRFFTSATLWPRFQRRGFGGVSSPLFCPMSYLHPSYTSFVRLPRNFYYYPLPRGLIPSRRCPRQLPLVPRSHSVATLLAAASAVIAVSFRRGIGSRQLPAPSRSPFAAVLLAAASRGFAVSIRRGTARRSFPQLRGLDSPRYCSPQLPAPSDF
jgi:hypothetical protein